ncbi:MAG: Ppx/GppA family phosphatase [Chelatococcus sp.]|nr:Ppx/GppA phosphatase family protein [Chelatococcus sp. HY11]MBS7738910.1 Ppx/GppA family phosphatase [Chelatococcus sp. HY11]MBX3538973.1 Ppx/GppA family phosphatase [Chelatococcus sp.]MBX3543343.1 Ppx/GppA family phosphatase [Chelatococcus sp.]
MDDAGADSIAVLVSQGDAVEELPRQVRKPRRRGRRRRWRRSGVRTATYAALDLGTNNCRLLVAEPTYRGFRVVDAFSRIVRLGEGLARENQLGEPAIARAIEALKICRTKIDANGVVRARLIATEACRAAVNGGQFIERVERETGLALEVVDRQTEAYLAVTGCANLADPEADAVIVFDIGGGSTEIIWLEGMGLSGRRETGERVRAWESMPTGVVTLAEQHGGADVTRESFEAMVSHVSRLIAGFVERAGIASSKRGFHLLGTSGTVTTIAGVHLALPRYDRRRVDGLWMADREVSDVIDHLLETGYEERMANPCIGSERADLVLAGCAILEAIRRAFPSERLRIADRGLREGILMTLMREDGVWRGGWG